MRRNLTAHQVLDLLQQFAQAHARVWIAGGWGIDALVAKQTRPHADLDIIVDARDEQICINHFRALGFVISEDARPTRFVFLHPDGREVDMHPVAFGADGVGVQSVPGGQDFIYPTDCFTTGTIDGHTVPCISAEQQVTFHIGYEPLAEDIRDMQVLHKHFNIDIPAPYCLTTADADGEGSPCLRQPANATPGQAG